MLFQMSLRTDASFQLSYGFYTKFLFSNLPNNKCFRGGYSYKRLLI